MVNLDLLDRKILALLDLEGDISISEMAKRLEISRQLASLRYKKLESRGLIFGSFAICDTGLLGQNWYRVLLRLLNITKRQKKELIDYLSEQDSVTWLGEVGGRWDVVVNFACESPVQFNEVAEALSVKFGSFIKQIEVLVYVDIHDYSRTYLDPDEPGRKVFFHKMKQDRSIKLDELDRSILKEISTEARKEYTTLGLKLGVSRNTVKKRIDLLKEKGLILGFRTFPNLDKIGYQSDMLFLEINKLNRERESELFFYLQMLPQVTFVVRHIGRWKIGIEIETKTSAEFQKILLGIRSHFSDIITDYDTFPLLKDHVVNYFPDGIVKK